MSSPKERIYLYFPIALAIVLALGIWIGSRINQSAHALPFRHNAISHFNKLNEVLNYIEQEYVDTINEKKMVDESIENLLSQLDPHSAYITAEDLQSVNEPLEGNFDGIGVEFHMQNDTIMVVTPLPGGPSETVGIRAGDRIIKVDDKPVAGVHISNTDVMQKLRGPGGTKVKVTISRKGTEKTMDFIITRGKIPIFSIDAAYMLNKETGYIKISRFAATTYEEYLSAFHKLKKQGLKTLVLDLQGNPGGYLNAATKLADEFLPKNKLIVYTQGKARPRETYYSTATGEFEKGKLIVLINEGSASASEILAGALQDLDRATIVGRRSYGKGLVQEQSLFPDGSAVRLTIARYYTPSGRCIQKSYQNGIEQYNEDLIQRMKSGEMESADSIKIADSLKYKTAGGRIVYGGGGIVPDVFVPLDTNSLTTSYYAGLINQFVFDFVDENREKLAGFKDFKVFNKGFNISKEHLSQFYQYLQKRGIKKEKTKHLDEYYLKINIKALIARQLFKNEGFYIILQETNPAITKALEIAEKKEKVK